MSNGSDWRRFGITTTIGVVTIVIGFIQFGSTSALSVRQPFVEHQTKLCLVASENAARLASTRNPEMRAKAREEFWRLYWGPLAMVEDVETTAQSRVEGAMVEFGRELSTDVAHSAYAVRTPGAFNVHQNGFSFLLAARRLVSVLRIERPSERLRRHCPATLSGH